MQKLRGIIETLFPSFQMVNLLSETSQGSVVQVRREKDKKLYILKLFLLQNVQLERVMKVVRMLNKIALVNSGNVVKFYEASYDESLTYLA